MKEEGKLGRRSIKKPKNWKNDQEEINDRSRELFFREYEK